jgi:5'-3' exonuclease
VQVHLVDGTYELFRHHFSPGNRDSARGATKGVVGTVLTMLERGATHVGVATDHVIESFRNDLWSGYKTSAGMPPELLAQFPVVEDALVAAGIATFPMVELEADDGLASLAAFAAADDRVERVEICTPDKDLGQCVGGKVFQRDRRLDKLLDSAAVRDKFGGDPESIPDYLALVGDSADGFPGLQGWGSKSAAAVLARYGHLEDVPARGTEWDVGVRNAGRLAATLQRDLELAYLFRRIATVESDARLIDDVDELRWVGPRPELLPIAERLDALGLAERAGKLAAARRERSS